MSTRRRTFICVSRRRSPSINMPVRLMALRIRARSSSFSSLTRGLWGQSHLIHKSLRNRGPNAVNRRQRYFQPAIVRYVNSSDQRHIVFLTLPLLVLRIRTQDPNHVAAADHLATGAHGLHRSSYLHTICPFAVIPREIQSESATIGDWGRLLESIRDSSTCQVVWRQLDQHAVPRGES